MSYHPSQMAKRTTICTAIILSFLNPVSSQDHKNYKLNIETIKSEDSSRSSKYRALQNLASSVDPVDAVQDDFNFINSLTQSPDRSTKVYAIPVLKLFQKKGAERLMDILINAQEAQGGNQLYGAAASALVRMKGEASLIAPVLSKVITRAVELRLPEIGNAYPGGTRYELMVKVLKELDTGDVAVINESKHWIEAATAMGNSNRRAVCSFIGDAAKVGMQYIKKEPEIGKKLIPTLIALLNVRDVDLTCGTVTVACETLGAIGADASEALPSLRKLLNHSKPKVQRAAEQALKQIRK